MEWAPPSRRTVACSAVRSAIMRPGGSKSYPSTSCLIVSGVPVIALYPHLFECVIQILQVVLDVKSVGHLLRSKPLADRWVLGDGLLEVCAVPCFGGAALNGGVRFLPG